MINWREYIFQSSNIPLSTWLKVIYYFASDLQLYQIQNLIPELSQKTLIMMTRKLRQRCANEVEKMRNSLAFGGDVELVSNVEIDESAFGKKRKNNKGKKYQKKWVFGITERNTNKVFFEVVDDRKKTTLLPIIRKYVSTHAVIHHDDWPSYRKLCDYGYKDMVVNHTKGFKGKDGACTNTIEGIWGVMKQRITRMHGVKLENLDEYLKEYTFRYHAKKAMLDELIKVLMC